MLKFLIFTLLLIGCSHKNELKYRYSYSKSYLASLTSEDVVVSRVEVTLQNETLFVSGMDSTFVIVKLIDDRGEVLTNVDPTDLTLSTDVDIEAKPFTLKQGIYKAEILPRVKSPSIRMRVDWQSKVLSKEIRLNATVAPIGDELIPLIHEFTEDKSVGEIDVGRGSKAPKNSTEAFSFSNVGPNRIVKDARSNPSRNFSFDYPEQSRQNIALRVDDIPNAIDSHVMYSVFMFFPRKQLPVVEQLSGTIDVTLPTGEKVVFKKESKEIIDGVLAEGPIDMANDRFKRSYPNIKYKGRGIVLRANARGQSPELGEFEKDRIDSDHGNKGSVDVLILNAQTSERCIRPKTDFWEPIDVNPIEFKFPTDEAFEKYLLEKCGFGIPRI